MNFKEFLSDNLVFLDGGMGTMLQSFGITSGEKSESWNLSHPDIITKIHKAYFEAGSNVVSTNTFGANSLKFNCDELEQIVAAAIQNAKNAKDSFEDKKDRFIALDIGPTGKLLEPFGDLSFDDAVEVFAKTIRIGVKHGVDLIVIETMNDSLETKAAMVAAKENSTLPVLVSNAYSNGNRLLTGAPPAVMVSMLEGLGADILGANCSFGPKQLEGVMDEILAYASVPVSLKPNAGLPQVKDGKVYYDVTASDFGTDVALMVEKGISAVGGCCGTTPEHINKLYENLKNFSKSELEEKNLPIISSRSNFVIFNQDTSIGEIKIPFSYDDVYDVIDMGQELIDEGADILALDISECNLEEIKDAANEWQMMVDAPIMIKASDPCLLQSFLRYYNGKGAVGKIDYDKDVLSAIFPIIKKYGGVAVINAKDEKEKSDTILFAKSFGISAKNIVFD